LNKKIPLKPANRHFTLFESITLPIRIPYDRFAQYLLDYKYLVCNTINKLTYCSQRPTLVAVRRQILLHVQRTQRFIMCRHSCANRVYTFRWQVLTDSAVGSFCSTAIHRFSIAMERLGYITSHHQVELHCTAQTTTNTS
jgi:hypothetical protein